MPENAEKLLDEARKWIGKESSIRWGKYPVEYEPIKRWCRMVDCTNPIYFDDDYAKKTKWQGVICPPLLVTTFAAGDAGVTEWPVTAPVKQNREGSLSLPVDRSLGVSRKHQFFKPVHIGDRLGSSQRLVDICLKPTRFSPETFWVTTEIRCLNQHLDLVATLTRTGIRFQSSGQKKAASAQPTIPVESPGTPLEQGNSGRNKQVYFEEVENEQELPGFSLRLDTLRFHLQSSGTQQFGLMHTDDSHARSTGTPHIFLDHGFTQAALSRVMTDWMGEEGWLEEFNMEMKKMNFLGDTITVKGKVTRKYLHEGQGHIDCDLWIENPRHGTATTGKATAALPFRPS